MRKRNRSMPAKRLCQIVSVCLLLWSCLVLGGCGASGVSTENSGSASEDTNSSSETQASSSSSAAETEEITDDSTPTAATAPLRDNTPVCLVPAADGTAETHNDVASIDYSHTDDGYICVNYTGSVSKVKLRIIGPDEVTYTYDLQGNEYETFPLTSGDGTYDVTLYENIEGTSYTTCLYQQISVTLADEFGPYLYPNQYVYFTADSEAVAKGAELAEGATDDLDVITSVYNYIISNITYDYDKATDSLTGYICDIDATLESGTGICLDYAAVMAAMLRSQQIPTRLEVGYASDAYHAWISVYTEETGWLGGIVKFEGDTWTLVDPTYGASTDVQTLKKFIGDGTNYTLQKIY